MKHFHLLMVVLTIGLFCYSAWAILQNKTLGKAFFMASHLIYLLVVMTGLYLLWQLAQVAGAQPWAYAKIVLLIVAISAMMKARKATVIVQQRVGLVISALALLATLGLAVLKPTLG